MGEPLNHDSYSDDYLRGILDRVKTIAMVGASEHWNRPSYFAMKYLQDKGYRVIPVNPRAERMWDKTCYPSVDAIPGAVDLLVVVVPAGFGARARPRPAQ